eukprot:737537-Prorocentrum_lima.AAC.1
MVHLRPRRVRGASFVLLTWLFCSSSDRSFERGRERVSECTARASFAALAGSWDAWSSGGGMAHYALGL